MHPRCPTWRGPCATRTLLAQASGLVIDEHVPDITRVEPGAPPRFQCGRVPGIAHQERSSLEPKHARETTPRPQTRDRVKRPTNKSRKHAT
eukprot:8312383-Alexandrium_andersonii.AAC.1